MSLAVTHRPSQHIIATRSSPMDSKASLIKLEDSANHTDAQPTKKSTPPRSDPPPTVKEPPDQVDSKNARGTTNAETGQPLAPPPRPAPSQQNTEEGLDYFTAGANNNHFSREPNPFDQSFGNPSSELPANKSLLPPVAALTSPAPIAGDGPATGGYGWAGSLRAGPLSPAMLGGPVGAGPGDYFDPSLRGSFPSGVTPNESSLRTGLTPGGGGSMFPAPSPNSQAIYQQLASGGATPSTLDFHRTALNAAAVQKGSQPGVNGASSRVEDQRAPVAPMDPALQQQPQQPTFGQHDNDAANGLYLLAQAGNGAQANNQFAVPNASTTSLNNRSQETSPQMAKGTRQNGSIGGQSELSGDLSDSGDQGKPATRGKGKRTSGGKPAATNGKRKPEDTPSKQSATKKQKNNGLGMDMDGMDSDEEQPNIKEEQYHADGKKMTDEEKRKNFLERNRVAALKCRQRKKQWLANLQAKVEIFTSENDSLTAQVASLREEVVGLKTLLLQHKDCPVSQQQGLGGYFQQQQQEFNPHANPYGMGMQNGQGVMAGQRR